MKSGSSSGTPGVGLNYYWNGTELGVKREDEEDYTFVDLKGDPGADGTNGSDGAPGTPGVDGSDGRDIELQINATHIQWRYVGDISWNDLIALTDLKGADGVDGIDGKQVQLQKNTTHIQWKYDTDITWTDLVALADLKGADGVDGVGVPTGGSTGQLLSKINGTDYNTQWIDPPNSGLTTTQVNILIAAALTADNQAKYKIGKIIFDTENVNPATYLGFGTWVLWGAGRVPVCVDTSDTYFDTSEETGGEKEVILTTNQMPSHTHTQNQHRHLVSNRTSTYASGIQSAWRCITAPASTNGDYNQNSYTEYSTPTNQNTGGNDPHNNLQPYITCYMWKRVS